MLKYNTLSAVLIFGSIGLGLLACDEIKSEVASEIISNTEAEFVPDKRVAIFEVKTDKGKLVGQTNLPEAHDLLLSRLDEAGIDFEDHIEILPHADLKDKTRALVTISVANLRSSPRHSAELATQAIMGTPLKVLKEDDNWFQVQTPDDYIAWVDAAGISLKSEHELGKWLTSDLLVFEAMTGQVYSKEDETEMVSDLTAGNLFLNMGTSNKHWAIQLPDGREGWVRKNETKDLKVWLSERNTEADNLIKTAKSMMGLPYLWGGTSIKGVDCSGFTKTIFFLNGQIIPRDASQQVHEGELVDDQKNWDNLQVGDLLFFGVPGNDEESEKVIHVGMWIGDRSFIHSRGRVRISSFDPESPDFDEYELNRYLRTKRIVGQDSEKVFPISALLK
ncbi:NlpC/P60 family protein [Pararhodonellum marinum]|uniref:NlpC/P60 family protein n=1 Tax=Pararhodonellum marinum TaxID=2755358 RepID=UPI00188EF4B4|nr:NlpC/P60 family protein [Pararhodonellum marinum]